MTFWKRIKAAMNLIVHPRYQSQWLSDFLPHSRVDYAASFGNGLGSNVAMAPVLWIARAFLEARMGVSKGREDELDLDHPLAQILAAPNPFYSGKALWMGTLISWFFNGNAYWLKARNAAGQLKELWYTPHWMIEPKWEGQDFISYYRYAPGGVGQLKIKPEDVVHLRHGLDPQNVRKGLSPMHSLMREVYNDDEAANFVASLLGNGCVPGLVISPKEANAVGTDDLLSTKNYVQAQFSGDKRGQPLVLSGPTEVSMFGYDPQKMNLGVVRDVSEERVCAVLGLPSAVVGFGSGIEQTKVGATLQELHRIAWVDCVIPNQDLLADEVARSLLPDFGAAGATVAWDRRRVRALEDDLNKQAERLERGVRGGWVRVSEARAAQGLPVEPEDEVYLRPINALETDGVAPQPEPAPTKAARRTRVSRLQTRIAAGMDRVKARAEARMRIRLQDFFGHMGTAASVAYRGLPKADEDELRVEALFSSMGMPNFKSELRGIFGSHYVGVHNESMGILANLGIGVNLPDSVQLEVLAQGGTRAGLVDLTEAARGKATDILRQAREEGLGVDETARRLAEQIPAGPWTSPRVRAEVTARTETRFAQNASALRAYRTVEGITSVRMLDARLGPTDQDCEDLNGEVVTFEEAEAFIRDEHPNGTRDMVPIFSEA